MRGGDHRRPRDDGPVLKAMSHSALRIRRPSRTSRVRTSVGTRWGLEQIGGQPGGQESRHAVRRFQGAGGQTHDGRAVERVIAPAAQGRLRRSKHMSSPVREKKCVAALNTPESSHR